MRICFYRILLVLLSHQIKTSPQYICNEEGAELSMVPLNCSVRVFWNTVSVRHYNDVIMSAMSFLITSLTIVYSSAYSVADQRKHQSSASLAFMRGIHRWPVNSPHKGPATPKMFPLMTSSWGGCGSVAVYDIRPKHSLNSNLAKSRSSRIYISFQLTKMLWPYSVSRDFIAGKWWIKTYGQAFSPILLNSVKVLTSR